MKALDRKLLRDLWRMRGQVLAIALVLGAATATFVLSVGVYRSLTETRDVYYERNHFADVFANLTRAPRSVVARIAALPGVQRAEGSIQQYATLEFPGRNVPVRALVNSVDEYGRDRLNLVTLREGRMPRPGQPGEVVVDEAFAEANNLVPGSSVAALIYGNRQRLDIVGIGLAPNYIYSIAPGDLIPDNERYGIFWMGRDALEAATDRREAINSLALTLRRGVSRADVIRQVDRILEPYGGTGAYGREDHISHAFLDSDLQQLDAMTRLIPPIFLLVSTFLVYIVLGRMIRTERTQIGLIKAFGYSSRQVAWHYFKFALAIALAGALPGSAAGIWMGQEMTRLYAEYYRFPFLSYHVSPPVLLAAASLSLLSATLGALGGMRSAVSLAPAVAMSPPPPPVYRSGAVENLGRLAGFSAIGHMIVRHIARWPGRSAITALGVALSLGLLFTTMQFMDSTNYMLESYFSRAQRQDLTVSFTEARNEDVLYEIAQIPGVMRVEGRRDIPVRLSNGNRTERTAIQGAPAQAWLTARIDSGGGEIAMPVSGLMLSRQLADQLAVDTGDRLYVEVLGGHRTEMSLPVASVVDEFIGANAYAAERTLLALARDAAPVGSALLLIDPAARDNILAELRQMPVVLGVTERSAAMDLFEEMIDENIFTMMSFYIAFASAIAVGVVYNSARILFSERSHELATLRVLGYQRSEVGLILIGELAILVLASVPLGGVIGYWLAQLTIAMFSSELFRLPFAPTWASFGYATVVILLAALATAALVALRVMRLDMVRVLKARE
ncbi:putative ABC transport system permease protein [Altererythrobacter atlanticus]|uniref:FtsX-like permease family protein n=1 Tax=Croceibacterium atlanticum TaxID=1267766 RepID=A0A0F7KTI6_9SPHN|nr:ABC transporter permease [Croceibacterium atlanticum]AKH42115.1 FtsX-like permease family protein [Croceibacterium atlanticum]MBB5733315.1 putative ABC transport system permease protein [Croceibacterium atlanticum]